jgi:phosphoribosyl 1,2-cyclic phosphodiesterase
MPMKIVYWGVRGSLPSSPTPQQWASDIKLLFQSFFKAGYSKEDQINDFMDSMPITSIGGFGTSTTSVEVVTPKGQIIIDGGSGIRRLSEKLMSGPCGKGQGEVHIFMTHFHWDHLIGLPFFAPHFIMGNKVNYYAVQPELEQMVRGKFRKPYFPVPFEGLAANIQFHRLEPRKPVQIADMTVTPFQLDHPDPCWGYKVESEGKVYSHCVDTEGTRISREALGPDLPLYQGVDLMYFDAQYTLPELAEKANWGHSAAQLGLDLAFRENIKSVIFAHHDPGADTRQLIELKEQTQEYYDWKLKSAETNHQKLPHVDWRFAFEGLEINL